MFNERVPPDLRLMCTFFFFGLLHHRTLKCFHMLGPQSVSGAAYLQKKPTAAATRRRIVAFGPTVAILDTLARAAMPSGAEIGIAT